MKLSELVNFTKTKKDDVKEDSAENEQEDNVDRTTKIKVIVAVLVVGFAVYVAWWVQEPGSVRGANLVTTMETTETAQVTQEISFADFSLDPAEVHIEKGTTVIWTNKDTVPHTVTGPMFTSGTLDRGQSYSFTFTEDGTYDYYCSFHSNITGRIIVGTGGDTQQTEALGLLTGTEELLPEAAGDLFPAAAEEAPVPTLYDESTMAAEPAALTSAPEVLAAGAEDENTEETAAMHEAADESDTLASSGPEDFLYAGAFAVILFLNRRKLLSALK
jgi:plastocyanin